MKTTGSVRARGYFAYGIAALGIFLCACGSSGGSKDSTPTVPTPPVPVLTTVNVALTLSTMPIGQTSIASASGLDQNGAAISIGTVTWSSGSPTIATVSSTGLITGVAAGQSVISAQAGGKTGTQTITVTLIPVANVVVSPAAPSVAIGGTQQFSATTSDANSNVLAGRVITWSSSDTSKVTITAAGLATAVAAGTATITATSEGKTGSTLMTVTPPPVATVTVAPLTASIVAGGTQQLTATTLAAGGAVLTGRVVTWSSSDATKASVNTTGLVTAVAAGTATITATSEGKTGTSAITVTAAGVTTPVITSVAPASLTPGGVVTITGTGFAASAASNSVTIGGAAAVVATASTTQLTATVPCLVSGSVPVIVSVSGTASNSVSATLAGTVQTLAIGQSVALLTEASVRCNELPITGGRYLISLFNTSTTAGANTPVTIRGASTASGANSSTSASPLRAFSFARRAITPPSPESIDRSANARAHATMLERNRQIAGSIRSAPGFAKALEDSRQRRSITALAVPATVGSTVTMHYGGFSGSCNTFTSITARVVAVTAHSLVLEDNASPTAGQVDADMTALGQLFESTLYPIEANFGDINAYDVPGALDNPGRVLMLFTPQENQPFPGGGSLLGHVTSCDMAPATLAGFAGSNQTKIFYARVPKQLTGSPGTLDSRAYWNAVMPGTLVHEAKHITSFAERLSRNAAALEESWLEEATAQIAPEIYSRTAYAGTSWKGNTLYANSIFCDARIGTAQCPNGLFLMQNHFNFLLDYYEKNDSKSILSPGSVDGDIYGSAWMFVRWLVDQYGGTTESTLLKSLVQESTLSGVANVTAKTGVSFPALLADWTMMLVADDYPGLTPPAGAKYTFPSWNTRDIWSGYHTDFGVNYPLFPLHENVVTFGSFNLTGTLPGASTGIIDLSGAQTAKQLLDLSGLAPGTTIRMSILRVQ